MNTPLEPGEAFELGSVFQINETHGPDRGGWVGAFVLATEIRSWGIQGFVCHIETHQKQSHAFIRLKWSEIDYIGHAALVPAPDPEDGETIEPLTIEPVDPSEPT